MRTMMIEVYGLEDLDSKAREHAIEQVTEYVASDRLIADDLTDIFQDELMALGYPVLDINWRLSHCQGDGVAFYGHLDSSQLHILRNRLMPELPDSEIELLEMNIEQTSSYYHHYNTMGLSYTYYGDMCEVVEQFVKNINDDIVDVSKRLEREGYGMLEYNESEEAIRNYIEFEQIEFTKDGDIFAIGGRLWK